MIVAPEIVASIFCRQTQSQYNLRQQANFRIPSIGRAYHDRESILYLEAKTWNLIPPELKQ